MKPFSVLLVNKPVNRRRVMASKITLVVILFEFIFKLNNVKKN
jgi:hypothetical protein